MYVTHAILFQILFSGARAFRRPSSLCLTDPAIPLEAGNSNMSITVDAPMERRCEATINFSDPAFLPVRYSFASVPCDGLQVNIFTVPEGAPNGEVDVIWQCAGIAPSCNHAVISGGLANSSMLLENEGLVGCLMEDLQTKTNLVTLTRPSGTFVKTAPTVLTTSTTSFLSVPTHTKTKTTKIKAKSSTQRETAGTETEAETKTIKHNEETETAAQASTLSVQTVDATGTAADSASTSTAKATSSPTPSGSTGDGVSVNSASRTTMSLTAVTMSIFSTLTVIQTVTAKCTSG